MKEQAEIYRVGLVLGLFKISEVIAWSDSVIQAEATPDIAIIEASISGSKGVNAVISALSEVTGDFDKNFVTRHIFRSMYAVVNQDRTQALQVARWLDQMVFQGAAPTKEAETEMWYFCDAIELAQAGTYGDVTELTDQMLQFLKQYSEPIP